jgi:hypothetical protein
VKLADQRYISNFYGFKTGFHVKISAALAFFRKGDVLFVNGEW